MTQADTALTGARAIVPTGKSLEISRRSMLAAVAALSAVTVPAVAIAEESPFLAHMRESRDAANAKFWKLHDDFRALEAAWECSPDESQEQWEESARAVHDAAVRTLMQPVFCPAAVLAKLKITRFDPAGYSLPYPVNSADQVIEWDLDRCAKATRASQ